MIRLPKLTLALLLLSCSQAASAWTLTPMKIERDCKAGETFTDLLVVDNSGSSEQKRFEIKIVDWLLDKNGELIYKEPTAENNSLSSNIVCTPMQFKAMPGERKIVRFTMSIPAPISNGEHTVGIQVLEQVIPKLPPGSGRINVGVAVKCGYLCAISILIPKIQNKAAEAVSLEFNGKPADARPTVDLLLKNSGNARMRPKWSFQIVDKDGKRVFESDSKDYLILGNSERLISIPVNSILAPAKYKITGKLDQGVNFPLQELEKEFDLPKQINEQPEH